MNNKSSSLTRPKEPTPPRRPRQNATAVPQGLMVVPVTFRLACAIIAEHHRHHQPPQGMKFALGVAAHQALVGVAVVGRPVARHLDDGRTAEVSRTCTDGTLNANSTLYAAAWRTARAMGYHRLLTYTEHGEHGASLRAAGWRPITTSAAHHGWDRPSRRRPSQARPVRRTRWEIARTPGGAHPLPRACDHRA